MFDFDRVNEAGIRAGLFDVAEDGGITYTDKGRAFFTESFRQRGYDIDQITHYDEHEAATQASLTGLISKAFDHGKTASGRRGRKLFDAVAKGDPRRRQMLERAGRIHDIGLRVVGDEE